MDVSLRKTCRESAKKTKYPKNDKINVCGPIIVLVWYCRGQFTRVNFSIKLNVKKKSIFCRLPPGKKCINSFRQRDWDKHRFVLCFRQNIVNCAHFCLKTDLIPSLYWHSRGFEFWCLNVPERKSKPSKTLSKCSINVDHGVTESYRGEKDQFKSVIENTYRTIISIHTGITDKRTYIKGIGGKKKKCI